MMGVSARDMRLRVDRSYVERLLLATEPHALDPDHHRPPLQPLHGHRDDAGRWTVGTDEAQRPRAPSISGCHAARMSLRRWSSSQQSTSSAPSTTVSMSSGFPSVRRIS
jgi:hypothetical protein